LELIKMLNEQNPDFTAGPSANDLYHWNIRLKNFDYDSELGQDLTEYTLMVDPMAVATAESGDVRVKQAEILVEMKFPPDYPSSAPQFRLIRPGLRLLVRHRRLSFPSVLPSLPSSVQWLTLCVCVRIYRNRCPA
jgi:hypothetical protein